MSWKIRKLSLTLNNYFKKSIFSGNLLRHLSLRMLKAFLADNFVNYPDMKTYHTSLYTFRL